MSESETTTPPEDTPAKSPEEIMREIGQALQSALNGEGTPKTGFALFVFEFGKPGEMGYISNANRADVMLALGQFLDKEIKLAQKSAAPAPEKKRILV